MTEPKFVDQTDLMILFYLRQDSRIPYSELGKKVQLTSAAVAYRVNKLIEKQILQKFTIEIDQSVLTPNYQVYLISATVKPSDVEINYQILNASRLFDKIIEVASSQNLVGITIPLSNTDLKHLVELFNNQSILDYSIVPIIEDLKVFENKEIFGEKVTKLYCPECQDEFEGEGFIDKIGKQVMGFCCKKCRDDFNVKYENIVRT